MFNCGKQVRQEDIHTHFYGNLGTMLDTYDWSTELQEPFDEAYARFTCCFTLQIEQFVPKRKPGCRRKKYLHARKCLKIRRTPFGNFIRLYLVYLLTKTLQVPIII